MKVLIADDDAQLVRALSVTLSARGYDVVTARDGREAIDAVITERPDLVLLDLGMPRLDGIGVLEGVRAWSQVPVLVLSGRTDSSDKVDALDAGASGFLLKNSDADTLVEAVRAAAGGHALLAPEVTRRVIESFSGRGPVRRTHDRLGELTEREREVLALIGEGLSNDEIGTRLVVSPATARTHVSRVMTKLGARDRAQLVVIAYQSGVVR